MTLSLIAPLLEHDLGEALVDRSARVPLRALLNRLPLLGSGGFEVLLGGRKGPVGFSVRATAEELGEIGEAGGPQIRDFLRARSAEESLSRGVRETWLEWDDVAGSAQPNFFFRLEPPLGRPVFAAATLDAIERALLSLGLPRSETSRDALRHCIAGMPAPACARFIGVMLARGETACRVTIAHMPLDELTAGLRRMGWTGDRQPVIALARTLRPHLASSVLHLDIGESVFPRLGFEIPLLDALLIDRGLMTSSEAEALRAWPLALHAASSPDWPAALHANTFVRAVNHIKLTLDPFPSAKAYLAFSCGSTFPHPRSWA